MTMLKFEDFMECVKSGNWEKMTAHNKKEVDKMFPEEATLVQIEVTIEKLKNLLLMTDELLKDTAFEE